MQGSYQVYLKCPGCVVTTMRAMDHTSKKTAGMNDEALLAEHSMVVQQAVRSGMRWLKTRVKRPRV